MDPDKEWTKWQNWLGTEPKGKTIKAQVVEMLAFRQIWEGFNYVHESAPEGAREDGTFLSWVRFGYARSQALGVRRMADMSRDVLSLARLIDRVWRYPTVLSRERFVRMQTIGEGNLGGLADGLFDELAGPGEYIDPRIPAQDYEDLQARTKQVRDWVNTSVAHLSPTGKPLGPFRLDAIHTALDVVAATFTKYNRLIRGESLVRGVIFTSPWPTVFRVPWIPDDDHFRRVLDKLDEADRRFLARPQD
jgi:hypothetical protein